VVWHHEVDLFQHQAAHGAFPGGDVGANFAPEAALHRVAGNEYRLMGGAEEQLDPNAAR